MIPIGLILLTVVVLNVIFILVDIYIYRKFRKISLDNHWNNIYSKIYLISIPIFGIWLVANSIIRWSFPIPSKFVTFSNYFLTFWYLPKLIFLIAYWIYFVVNRLIRVVSKSHSKGTLPYANSARRKFITTLGWSAVGLPYLALAHESFKTTLSPKVITVEVPLLNLSSEIKELRMVQISDIHAGSLPSVRFFTKIVGIINSLNPDFVFVTGDFVNFSYKEIEIISESLSNIRAKYSVLACPGNHEHYMKKEDFERLADEIRKCNVDLLINENRVFKFNESQLQVAGVDNTNHRMNYADFDKALYGLKKEYPIILLCHDPTNWDKSVRKKRKVDLMLSGHTHGGQIAFEILNSKISPAAFFYKQYAGLYADKDQYLYVNTGVGMVGVPVRAGLPPEITLIRFVDAEKYA